MGERTVRPKRLSPPHTRPYFVHCCGCYSYTSRLSRNCWGCRHWARGWCPAKWLDFSHYSNAKGVKAQPPYQDAKSPDGTDWAEDEWYTGDWFYAFDFPKTLFKHDWRLEFDRKVHYVRQRVWRRGVAFLPGAVERSPIVVILDGWGELIGTKKKAWRRRFFKLRPASVTDATKHEYTHTLEYFKSDKSSK